MKWLWCGQSWPLISDCDVAKADHNCSDSDVAKADHRWSDGDVAKADCRLASQWWLKLKPEWWWWGGGGLGYFIVAIEKDILIQISDGRVGGGGVSAGAVYII